MRLHEILNEDGMSVGSYAGAGGPTPSSDATSVANLSYPVGKGAFGGKKNWRVNLKAISYNPTTRKWG